MARRGETSTTSPKLNARGRPSSTVVIRLTGPMYRYSTVRLMSDQLPIVAAAVRLRDVLNLVDHGRGPATLAGRLQPDKLPAVIGPNLGTGAGAVHPVHRLTEHRHGTAGHVVPDPLTAGGLQMHDDHGLRRAIVKALHVAPAVS